MPYYLHAFEKQDRRKSAARCDSFGVYPIARLEETIFFSRVTINARRTILKEKPVGSYIRKGYLSFEMERICSAGFVISELQHLRQAI